MPYLKQFWRRLKNLLQNNSSKNLSSSDSLARFLTSSGFYAKTDDRVKYRAFLPAPNGQLSVFSIERDEELMLRNTALEHVHSERPNVNIHGYALNTVGDYKIHKLSIIRSEPPPNHMNIERWPTEKDEQIFIAQEIADKAKLRLFKKKIKRKS